MKKHLPASVYDVLAHCYDWVGALDFSEQLHSRIGELFEEYALHSPARIADWCCGTGTLTLALAQDGFTVTGIDISEAMLSEAQRKAGPTSQPIQWLAGDIRELELDKPANAALCTCDSLNHLLTPKDLTAAFENIGRQLEDGGLFIFDLNTRENFETFWQGEDSWEEPNCRVQVASEFDLLTGRAEATFTLAEHTEAGLIYTQGQLTEQYYDPKTISKLLTEAGFSEIVHEPFTPDGLMPEGEALKTLWHAVKGT